jgi:two-component system cell cycle sensor histidine kinase/response regulator CckA
MALSAVKTAATKATRILIVEDEPGSASLIASGLSKTGYEVAGIAESSEEALVQAAALNPELILMDVRIRGAMDGIETAAIVRERFDIPVIYVVGPPETEAISRPDIDRAKKTGAFCFLTKPIHQISLAASIELALHKHQLERESRHEWASLTKTFHTMADAVAVMDRDRKLQFQNRAAEELTGWISEEARGVDIGKVLPLVDAASGAATAQALTPPLNPQRHVQIPRGLIASTRAGKQFPVEGEIAACVEGGEVVGAVMTFRDAAARQAQENELRHRDKMQAVGPFAAGIAHDFNNLLFIILGYTEEMLHAPGLTESALEALTAIKKAGESATRITEELLKFSRKGPAEMLDVNLNELIGEMEERLRRLGGPSIKWQFRLDQELGTVRAGYGDLRQVLMNLAAYACHAMAEDGGTITVETMNAEVTQPSSSVPRSCVALRVSNTGAGMTAETAQHLFEPFYTTKETGKGTGLGLTIVDSIVTDLGGRIHVNSEPGRGATLTIYFPRAETAAGMSGNPATILLADDEKGVRNLLRGYLVRAGYTVLEAGDGEEAIRIGNAHAGTIDLLITDVVMPKASGFDVARALSGQAGIRILFVSGHAQEFSDGHENLPAGALFLPKPFKRAEFLKNVRDLLATQQARTLKSNV